MSKLILSLDYLKNFNPDVTMTDAVHKVNHIDIAPDGKRFIFCIDGMALVAGFNVFYSKLSR